VESIQDAHGRDTCGHDDAKTEKQKGGLEPPFLMN
jgi:hypothetical protein